jgi:hypothetical protein
VDFTGTFLAPAEQITPQLGFGTEKSTMKMLRWGYVYSLLALALLCAAVAPRQASAAIYTASLTSNWTITGFSMPGAPPGFGISQPDGLVVAGSGDTSFLESNVLGGTTVLHDEQANIVAASALDMVEGDLIQLITTASGTAPNQGDRTESVASAWGQMTFTNESTQNVAFSVLFSVQYDYSLSTTTATSLEDAEAFAYLHLFEDLSVPDTWLEVSTRVQGGVDSDPPGETYAFDVILTPNQTRSLSLEISAGGFAEYRIDNSGGGSGDNDPNAVPEPSTIAIWSLFGVVGLTVGAIRRRRK